MNVRPRVSVKRAFDCENGELIRWLPSGAPFPLAIILHTADPRERIVVALAPHEARFHVFVNSSATCMSYGRRYTIEIEEPGAPFRPVNAPSGVLVVGADTAGIRVHPNDPMHEPFCLRLADMQPDWEWEQKGSPVAFGKWRICLDELSHQAAPIYRYEMPPAAATGT